jgi:signal transduction histidine kinase
MAWAQPCDTKTNYAIPDSTQWYGCESVTHHGGLCERTITQQNSPGNMGIYEELDMAKLERTKNLPFVQGEIANFRHYAGVPLNPYNGSNIGTVFTFSSKPSETGLSAANRSYMFEIASHITKHLEQAVEALEGRRVSKFNHGVASLLRMGSSLESPDRPPLEGETGQQSLVSNLCTDSVLRLYKLAATLLYDAFEFDGVRIQELDRSDNYINKNPNWNGSDVLAEHIGPEVQKPKDLSQALTCRLLEQFPQGVVLQVLGKSGAVVAATSAGDVAPVNPVMSMELSKSFPKAEQIILMPLWDIFHERNTGAVLAFANDQSRVYLGSTDLSSISAFCTTIMTQVRRLEAKAMDKIKSDFLGSVSHELRTPLHGMLSSLELLAGTPHNAHQHDLLEIARYSGSSLLDTIERILYFSNISSQARTPDETSADGSTGRLIHPSSLAQHQSTTALWTKDTVGIVAICEEVIQGEAQRLRLKAAVQPEPNQYVGSWEPASATDVRPKDPRRHPILVFDTNAAWSCRFTAVASFRAVLTNLLVSHKTETFM